jgi:hemolysin activation/secretion protein
MSYTAVAQDAIPDSAEAGRIEQQFESPDAPLSQFETLIPDSEEPMPAEDAARIKFTLSGVMVDGSTVYGDGDLLSLYEEMLGSEISLADVFTIARRITVKYRGDGYILSRAVVPAERIKSGVVVVQVVEGFVSGVSIEGEIFGPASLLESYAAKVMESRPLKADVLERYVLLADDLPGVEASSVLAPADDTPGASELILVVEHKEGDLLATHDNRGTRFVGPHQITTGVSINSGLGLYEKIGGRFVTTTQTRELTLFGIDQEYQIGSEGTKLTASLTGSKSQPGFTLESLEVKSKSVTGSVGVSHPYIRSRGENLSFNGTFTYKTSKTDLLGAVLTQDRHRNLSLGANYDFVDNWLGINLFTGSVTQGLDILGATRRRHLRRCPHDHRRCDP